MPRFTQAVWRGPVPNESPGRMVRPLMGGLLHIEEGSEPGTNNWFHNPGAQASAHFGNPKSGPLDQWVDTIDMAWAEAGGNPKWISMEHEGRAGDSLTDSQLENDAQWYAWLHETENAPLQPTHDVNIPGLGYHAMGGQAWGGHLQCPGDPIIAAIPLIIVRAVEILGGAIAPPPTQEAQDMIATTPSGNGYWVCKPDGSIWSYGDAQYHGGCNPGASSPMPAGHTATGFAAYPHPTLDGSQGYWITTDFGGVYAFGCAPYHGGPNQ